VGPNGAGKSTILRHLCGAYRQDSGEITLEGAPIYENPAVKTRMAVIPDELYDFGAASTRDMMKFYRGIYPQFDLERYEKLKDAFPAVDQRRPIRRLSKGMQKQSAFWLALSCKPDYLLLDEPVDGLDPVMRRQVWSLLMGDVAERGTTVLVSSHNLRELEDVCDHVGLLSHGKVALERSLSELQGGTVKLQAAFEGEAPQLPQELQVIHTDRVGKVYTYIIRGGAEEVTAQFAQFNPLFTEALPLSLEEIFIYEMGGEDYAVRDIVL
ncbi:MAG: ABC transporter ATP-binding protein, partial [Oscillospiraceae bacterium]